MREGIGVALAFAGTVLIATGGDFTTLKLPLVGLIWGAINAASTAAMVFLPVKLIERWGNFTVNGIAFLISGLVLLPFVRPWATAPQLDWLGVGLMAFTVIGGTIRRVLAVHGRRGARRFDACHHARAPANR